MVSRRLRCVAAIFILSSPAPLLAQRHPISLPQKLNPHSGVDSALSIDVALDSSGNSVAVWSSNDPANNTGSDSDLFFSRSSDGGHEWSSAVPLNSDALSDGVSDNLPAIGVGDGVWIAAWNRGGSQRGLRYVRSTDGGQSWTAPTPLIPGAASDDSNTNVHIATDGAGHWVVVWQSDQRTVNGVSIGSDLDILVSHSSDGGLNWSPEAVLNSTAATDSIQQVDREAQVATNGQGTWVAVWSSAGTMMWSRSRDNGQTWTPAATLWSGGGNAFRFPTVAAGPGGLWLAGWRGVGGGTYEEIRFARSTDDAESWMVAATPLNTDFASDTRNDLSIQFAWPGNGDTLAIWTGNFQTSFGSSFFLSQSADGGQNWSSPQDIFGDNYPAPASSDVRLAGTGEGRLVLAWTGGPDANVAYFAWPDCNANYAPDDQDVAEGASPDCNTNGEPDECEVFSEPVLAAPVVYPMPNYVYALGSGDVEGDGDVDLVVLTWQQLQVFVNDGHGAFTLDQIIPATATGVRLVIADMDGDGDGEIVHDTGSFIHIYHRTSGGYTAPVTRPAGGFLSDIVVADVNRDGFPDVVASDSSANELLIFLNPGDGNLAAPMAFAVGDDPSDVEVADLDRDGDLDVVVANRGGENQLAARTLSILSNTGYGDFAAHQLVTVNVGPTSVAAGDIDGDDDLDLVVAYMGSQQEGYEAIVSIIRNDAGHYVHLSDHLVGVGPNSPRIIDVNIDGVPDIVVAGRWSDALSCLIQTRLGTLLPERRLATGRIPSDVVAADLNGDGIVDFAVSNGDFQAFSVLLNTTGLPEADCNLNGRPDECDVAGGTGHDADNDGIPDECAIDCDANGRPDVVDLIVQPGRDCNQNQVPDSCDIVSGSSPDVNANLKPDECEDCDGDGVLDAQEIAQGAPDCNHNGVPDHCDVAAGHSADEDHDGVPDECQSDCDANGLIDSYEFKPILQFSTPTTFAAGQGVQHIVSADLDGDADVDLVTGNLTDQSITVLRNDGHGGFALGGQHALNESPYWIMAGDLDGDSRPEVITSPLFSNTIIVMWNDGTGAFTQQTELTAGTTPRAGSISDLNADGVADLIIPNANSDNVSVFLGLGNRAFTTGNTFPSCGRPVTLRTTDVDGDTRQDALLMCENGTKVFALLGAGDGSFGPPVPLGDKNFLFSRYLAVADFDGDNDPDVAVTEPFNSRIYILLNDGTGILSVQDPAGMAAGVGPLIDAVDVDLDGQVDLIQFSDSGGSTLIFRNAGGGVFENPVILAAGARSVAVAQLDGLDLADLAVAVSPNLVRIYHGSMGVRATDCNGNGEIDFCEVADGTSDCDHNFVPDECEPDTDGDGHIDACDTCPLVADSGNVDTDGDGVGDVCDVCPFTADADQSDLDADGRGDACDDDIDGDGHANSADNCPLAYNPGQQDADGDGAGDACDACPGTVPGSIVGPDGCIPQIRADYDGDGDVDQSDFARMQMCLTGPSVPPSDPLCQNVSLDADADVDAADVVIFLRCLRGARIAADPECAP